MDQERDARRRRRRRWLRLASRSDGRWSEYRSMRMTGRMMTVAD
jgi:hypothetical protein